ncbi:DNA polymerase III subunit gamma and tau [Actinoplanes regularis]|uniref:DNA polymerase III subunit gamma and tau n=1 Tax=Actinoplanes regularis TaxID=52697 RepID=UPI0024A30D74|nr:DNA polymerase III subunit gamma and tau [Actinoplanes regularis]GLW30177.1 hypothetical protein Areg01_31170 [Actinoplanes regularis]
MALALYRKYRPRTFAEIIGQEHVTEPLSQALRSGRLNHAYLFSGPRGCGKTSSARILARSLNCEQGPTPEPCGVCASCKSLANDGAGSIDVIEIDAASHGGVDDARELREKAFFAPASSRYKIYVIDEAHMVSSAGFNALLKLVEEPPDYVKFIFATTEPDKVLGTIRSRTHHYPFRLIPPATLRPYLQQLTEAEGVRVEPAVFPLVVRAGGGSARDTLSVLDQLIAGAGPDGVSYARAVALLGVTDVALIDEMCDALAAGNGAAAYETIDRVAEAGHDPRRYASDLLERFRDLIVLQQVPDAVAKGLIDGPADQLEAMHAQASQLGAATLSRCADIVHNGLVEMRGTTAPRLLLELITARMLLPGADDSTGALLQRLERLEKRGPMTVSVSDAAGMELVAPGAAVPAGVPTLSGASGAAPPAVSDASSGGKAAARAAALAAGRRTTGASVRPVSPAPAVSASSADPVPAAPPVQAAPMTAASGTEARGEADWNQVADGGHHDDEPPWDPEPPVAQEVAAPAGPRADESQVRAVWQAFGPKHDKIQLMQNSGIGIRAVEDGTVVFAAPSPRYAERFLTYTDVIIAEFDTELGGSWQIRCEVGESAARGPAPVRDQTAGRNVSPSAPGRAAPSSAPERNTGRTESRPPRPQRAPVADSDDDWPAPSTPLSPEPDADSYIQDAQLADQSVGGAVAAGPDRREAASAPPVTSGDTDWPEPVRPGTAAPGPAQAPADDDWPEPVKPGTRAPAPAAASQPAVPSTTGQPSTPSAASYPAASSATGNPDASSAAGHPDATSAAGHPAVSSAAGHQASPSAVSQPAVPPSGAQQPAAPAAYSPRVSSPSGAADPYSARPEVQQASGSGSPSNRPTASASPTGSAGPGTATPAVSRSPAMEAARAAAARGGNAAAGSGLAAARAAAANARNATPARATSGSSPVRAAGGSVSASGGPAGAAAWSDGSPIGEAPYDPEYDGAPPAGAGYEGFDPGDEPLDEVIDEKTARQSSEEQAFQLLRDAFGAEKIGDL